MTAANGSGEEADLDEVRRRVRNLVNYSACAASFLKAGRLDSAEWWLGHAVEEAKKAHAAARHGIEHAGENKAKLASTKEIS